MSQVWQIILVSFVVSCNNQPHISDFVQTDASLASDASNQIQFGTGLFSEQGELIKFPDSSYAGHGTMNHRGGSASTSLKMIVGLDQEQVVMNIASLRATAGDYVDKANQALASAVGKRISKRASKDELRKLTDKSGPNFMVFINQSKTHNGIELNYQTPIPILVIPGPASRYEDIGSSPLVYSTKAEGGRSFDLTVTVRMISSDIEQVKIEMETYIPQDTNGSFYEVSVLPKLARFTIDTKLKKITKLVYENYYRDSEENKRYLFSGSLQLKE